MSDHSVFQGLVLGAVQGLTEFLPISSSGHLVLIEHALPGWHPPGVAFDTLLHLGTLVSVLVYYRHQLWHLAVGCLRRDRDALRYVAALLVGTVVTGVIGVSLKDWFETQFSSVWLTGLQLVLTGGLLLVAQRIWNTAGRQHIRLRDAGIIGLAQAVAIAPGISRSGSTVVGALAVGIEPDTAARFSFLLSIPAVAGAVVLKMLDGGLETLPPAIVTVPAVLVSFGTGMAAIHWFVRAIVRGRFSGFAAYCVALGGFAMAAAQWLGWGGA